MARLLEGIINNAGKIGAGIAAAFNFGFDLTANGRYNINDFLLAGLALGAGYLIDSNRRQKDKNSKLESVIQAADSRRMTDRFQVTMNGEDISLLSEGKQKALRRAFDVRDSDNLTEEVSTYVKKAPGAGELIRSMVETVKSTGQSMSRVYFNPKTKMAIEFEVHPGKNVPFVLLAREKTEYELKDYLVKLQGPIVAQYILSGKFTEKPSRHPTATVFVDLREFGRWSSTQTPEHIERIFSSVYAMSNKIFTENGMVCKYTYGDRVVGFAGPPLNEGGVAYRAAHSAIKIIEEYTAGRDKLKEKGILIPGVGIGLSFGDTVAGFFGRGHKSEGVLSNPYEHVQYDFVGESVNIASRLCDNAPDGVILATTGWSKQYYEEIRRGEADAAYYNLFRPSQQPLTVKGYDTPIPILFYLHEKKTEQPKK